MKKPNIRRMPTERISQTVLYAIVGVVAVVFALFRFVGYDTPYYDNPELNAPLLTDLLLAFMVLLTLMAIIIAVWTACRSFAKNRNADKVVNGIHAARLVGSVVALTMLILVATFALAPTQPIVVNGEPFADRLWLRTAEMFIDSSLLLIAVAMGAVMLGAVRGLRKERKGERKCS